MSHLICLPISAGSYGCSRDRDLKKCNLAAYQRASFQTSYYFTDYGQINWQLSINEIKIEKQFAGNKLFKIHRIGFTRKYANSSRYWILDINK